jgi:prepilin-type N-terminal cleavage/methylation domain-containing protein
MALAKSRFSNQSGFSLAEVLVATGILATALVSLAQLFAIAVQSNTSARDTTFSTVLAQQKLEQLRALSWGFDELGLPVSDMSTNTGVQPEEPFTGTGLSPSPDDALLTNVDGYHDYVDLFGNIVGFDDNARDQAVYFRRWSVEPLPTNPNNTLILQVVVGRMRDRGLAEGTHTRVRDEARVMTVKTRKSR